MASELLHWYQDLRVAFKGWPLLTYFCQLGPTSEQLHSIQYSALKQEHPQIENAKLM